MRRLLPALALPVLLAGCGGSVTAVYRLDFGIDDTAKQAELSIASLRVAERRLERIGETVIDKSVTTKSDGTFMTLVLGSPEGASTLQEELTRLFSLRFMKEVPEAQAELFVEDHGGFASTGVTEEHLAWVRAETEPSGKGRIRLLFTPEGRTLMEKVFKENKGKALGLFVRDVLVSKLVVDSGQLKDEIVIGDIPSAELAYVFADDVIVGLYVTFVPAE